MIKNLKNNAQVRKNSHHPLNKPIKKFAEPLNVSVRLATFTLGNVLKNQGLFYQALEVLDLLEKKVRTRT
ncbi:MAG: hypothetical protein Ct9H300mP2_5480 [Candidatus Neomarinimicrobiota bacterium]|nr:MAG: hypothetical protein Ct9H300mP2_5480 [Candidatus Neomarinimicrobiota bacterium]